MTFTTRADRFNDRVIQYHAYSSRSLLGGNLWRSRFARERR